MVDQNPVAAGCGQDRAPRETSRQDVRAQREAEALRENLRRRKEQARARKATHPGDAEPR